MMIRQSDIVKMARSWIGTPYRHQGRSRRGVDCAGPLVDIARQVGLGGLFDDQLIYNHNPATFSLQRQMDSVLDKIQVADIRPGDVMLFKIDVHPQHVAIATDYQWGGLGMVHCYDRVGQVVEHRLADVWRVRIMQAYRIPGIVEDM